MLRLEDAEAAIIEICTVVGAEAEHFRELDARAGDGDLGVTVRAGLESVERAVQAKECESYSDLFALVGDAFANANPSTLANLVRAGCRATAKELGEVRTVEATQWLGVLAGVVEAVARKGKVEVGDKTVLDGLYGSLTRLRDEHPDDGLSVARAVRVGAEEAATSLVALQARAGRASWLGGQTIGMPDPGAEVWVSITRAVEGTASRTQAA